MAEFNIEINVPAPGNETGKLQAIDIGNGTEYLSVRGKKITRKRKSRTNSCLGEQFIPRCSLLTNLFEDDNFRCVYRISFLLLALLYFKSVLDEIVSGHERNLGLKYILKSFEDALNLLTCFIFMFILMMLEYVGFSVWATTRQSMVNYGTTGTLQVWNLVWAGALLFFCLCIFLIPFSVTHGYPAMVNQFLITLQQIVFMMKSYSFLRMNVSMVISYKPHSDVLYTVPAVRNYLYFLFAPTLVYKEKYPRSTDKINPTSLFGIVFDMCLISVWINYLLCRLEEKYKYFGMHELNVTNMAVRALETALIAPCLYVSIFYLFLHLCTNFWAELLRFSDRQFYQDWWNSTNIKSFCRTSNTPLYDFIQLHVCKELEKLHERGKTIPIQTIVSIILISFFYEYLITFTVGICLPVTCFVFLITIPSIFIDLEWGILNWAFWFVFVAGSAAQVNFLAVEYFARLNCPYEGETFWDFFEIVTLSCNSIVF